MQAYELVRRAIEIDSPPRIPFFQHVEPEAPDDVWDIWEMDRAHAGWFFDIAGLDDWGCVWTRTELENMGQVVQHPLALSADLDHFRPPDPFNPYYFERIEPLLHQAKDRYVVVPSHFNLIERLHMLQGFCAAMERFYLEPEVTERLLDMILEFKITLFGELHRRFGNSIHGLFLTDDWGTQQGVFISREIFEHFFAPRYRKLFDAIHQYGWHVILHSCGKINALVPRLIELGVDVLNMQQPNTYGLVEFGEQFKGKVCFLTTVDIQATLPKGDEQKVIEEVHLLLKHWNTPKGGFVVFNYGNPQALGISPEVTKAMFLEFAKNMYYK